MASSKKGSRHEKMIIDCDGGIDDVQAIMIALSQGVDVLGITCTFGMVDVDQVAKNVLKMLDVCGRTDIPVYKGAHRSMHAMEWEFYDRYVGVGTKQAQFMKKVSSMVREHEGGGPYVTSDPFAICAALEPKIVLQEKFVYATVELKEGLTHGQMVVDWRGLLKKDCNVRLLEKLDLELFMTMLLHSVK